MLTIYISKCALNILSMNHVLTTSAESAPACSEQLRWLYIILFNS